MVILKVKVKATGWFGLLMHDSFTCLMKSVFISSELETRLSCCAPFCLLGSLIWNSPISYLTMISKADFYSANKISKYTSTLTRMHTC